MTSVVLWHDLECGSYSEDLPLWRELAARAQGPVLDVGAGTGRVALDLARLGYDVVALDMDAELLDALARRAGERSVATVHADARSFALDERDFALVLVPMQTIQLLGGADGRAQFLGRAHAHLRPGGLLAIAIADALEAFDEEHSEPPLPDIRQIDGVVYASRPVRIRDEGERVAIERVREVVSPDGSRAATDDVIRLDRVDAAQLGSEGEAAGFVALASHAIDATDEYVGSTVVVLRA